MAFSPLKSLKSFWNWKQWELILYDFQALNQVSCQLYIYIYKISSRQIDRQEYKDKLSYYIFFRLRFPILLGALAIDYVGLSESSSLITGGNERYSSLPTNNLPSANSAPQVLPPSKNSDRYGTMPSMAQPKRVLSVLVSITRCIRYYYNNPPDYLINIIHYFIISLSLLFLPNTIDDDCRWRALQGE